MKQRNFKAEFQDRDWEVYRMRDKMRWRMKTEVLEGPKQRIAERVAAMSGDVVRAIVFVEDATDASGTRRAPADDPWMKAFQATLDHAVAVGEDVDDSRESIYRGRGE
jgi:hypothetical protein